jgi:hypothetical protein
MALTPEGKFSYIEGPVNLVINPIQRFQEAVESAILAVVPGGTIALADPSSNGIIVRDSVGHSISRTITGTTHQISVANGDGVSGNPTLSIPSSAELSIAKLTNLTSNGFIKTSSSDGSLSIGFPTATEVGLGNVTNDAQVKRTEMGVALGVATLDGTAKIPLSQIPDTVVGAVEYQGTWNASTNSPNLGASSPSKGDYYVVSVDGSTSLGGITDWKTGDWAIYNGTAWQKVDNTDQVSSVFGRQGTVVAVSGDYSFSLISGTAQVNQGGTGAVTLASNGVLYGNGTSAIQALAVNSSATRKILTQISSSAPTWEDEFDSLTVHVLIGSKIAGESLELRSTSATGTTDFTKFTVGNNGSKEAMRITHDGNVGIGTIDPIFNDDGTTGANVGAWLAVDGTSTGSGYAAYFGVGGTVPGVTDRVGVVNFFNYSMGGVDHRVALIGGWNDGTLGRGKLTFATSPSNVGPVDRMIINYNGDVAINHNPSVGVRLQVMGATSDSSTYSMLLLDSSDSPYAWFRNDRKIFLNVSDPASVVAPYSGGVFTAGSLFSVYANGNVFFGGQLEGPTVFIDGSTANLFMKDTSTGWQVASTTVITPQSGNAIRNTSFTSGLVGWNISDVGDAEMNNLTLRGALRTAILLYNAVLTTAGTQLITPSAGKLKTDVVIPSSPTYGTTTVAIDIVDQDGLSHAASQLFAVNDILYMKDGLLGYTYFKVTAVSDQTTFWRYTASIQAGTNNITYHAGLGVVDYKQSGAGFIVQTADAANAPYLQMATHAGTFSAANSSGVLTVTPQLRLGNLNGSYGYNTDIYGLGAGQYGTASKSWITVEQTNGIRIGNNTTQLAQWDISGNITVGQVTALQSNILISSGALDIRVNTTARIHLASDGSGYLANSSISWDTSGNLTVAANANIAGWTISSTEMTSGAVHLVSNGTVNTATAGAYFGKDSGANAYGWVLADGTRSIMGWANLSGVQPFIGANDGTYYRVVIGGVNYSGFPGGSSTGYGLKVGDSSNNLLVEFSNTKNVIAGWTITSTTISSTGVIITSGSGASLAFGATPPTGVATGTGVYEDATGLFGVKSSKQTFALSATDGTLKLGSDLSAASTTAFVLAGTAITYNSESLAAGAALFGDNSSTKANMLYSAGTLKIRRGTTDYITFSSTDAQFTNVINMSGASSAIAIGSTPPTSASAGTGIWLDRTGMYGLSGGAVQAKFDAVTGWITAGGGKAILDSNGYSLLSASGKTTTNSFKMYNADGSVLLASLYSKVSDGRTILLSEPFSGVGNKITIQADAFASTAPSSVELIASAGGTTRDSLIFGNGVLTYQLTTFALSNTINSIAINQRTDSATPAAGFGTTFQFNLQSTTTNDRDAARIGAIWTTATDATRTSAVIIQTVNSGGALAEVARFAGNGDFTFTGLLKVGSGPTTHTDSTGKILSAALNTVGVAQGGTGKASWTTGSIPYASGSTTIAEDNGNFFWDGTNHRLGIGTTAPTSKLHVDANNTTVGEIASYFITASFANIRGSFLHGGNAGGYLSSGGLQIVAQGAANSSNGSGNINFFNPAANSVNNSTDATLTLTVQFKYDGSVIVGAPTGGGKGAGTVNAQAVYDDNVLLTDWVFDLHMDGKVHPRNMRFHSNKSHHRLFALSETRNFVERDHRLPWMPKLEEFDGERHIGGMVSRLYQGQEQQQLYLFNHEDRISILGTEIQNHEDRISILENEIQKLKGEIKQLKT